MYKAYAALKVSIGRCVLIVSTGRTVVGEAKAFPRPEMHVQQSLICSIKADTTLSKRQKSVVIAHIWFQREDSAVEAVRPADIGDSSKRMGQVEELVRSSQGNDICIDVHNMGVLCLFPESNLCKCGRQIRAIHQVKIGGIVVDDPVNWNDSVIDGLFKMALRQRLASQGSSMAYL